MMGRRNIHNNKSGFTIVELMIATLVFTVILLVATIGVMSFTKSYYKGITEANTQNVTRSIVASISQTVQFSGSDYVQLATYTNGGSTWNGFCFGDTGFVYQPGLQLVDGTPDTTKHQTNKVMYKVNVAGGCAGQTISNLLNGSGYTKVEMLSPHMRLANLSLTQQANNLFALQVSVAYGDDDLLTLPTSTTPKCISQEGSQFCAVSTLSTVVQKRIQS